MRNASGGQWIYLECYARWEDALESPYKSFRGPQRTNGGKFRDLIFTYCKTYVLSYVLIQGCMEIPGQYGSPIAWTVCQLSIIP